MDSGGNLVQYVDHYYHCDYYQGDLYKENTR